MGINKIVKCRKEHTCAMCEKTISKGDKAYYMEIKNPVYETDFTDAVTGCEGKQVGLKYLKLYYCYDENTELMPACGEEYIEASDSNCAFDIQPIDMKLSSQMQMMVDEMQKTNEELEKAATKYLMIPTKYFK